MFKELNILEVFFASPRKQFNVREVARILKITPATASKRLKELAKKGILSYRKENVMDFYRANLDNDEYRDMKVFYMIRRLKETGFIESLNKFYLKPTIILFGSAATGLDTEDSDIDLVVLSERKDKFPLEKEFEKKLGRPLQIFVVRDLKDLGNPHLINNVFNGITIQGEIRWI